MLKITTINKEYGTNEGLGILIYYNDNCLEISRNSMSSWYIGRGGMEDSSFMIRLGRLTIDFTEAAFSFEEWNQAMESYNTGGVE